jgi:hypothetical protein
VPAADYQLSPANPEVILLGIPNTTSDADLMAAIGPHFQVMVVGLRIPKDRSTKQGKGIAFITFRDTPAAETFIAANQGVLSVGARKATLDFSRDSRSSAPNASAAATGEVDPVIHVPAVDPKSIFSSETPAKTLLCADLAPSTTAESLLSSFTTVVQGLSGAVVLFRQTGESCGFGFLRFDTIQLATVAYDYARSLGFLIDGMRPFVIFSSVPVFEGQSRIHAAFRRLHLNPPSLDDPNCAIGTILSTRPAGPQFGIQQTHMLQQHQSQTSQHSTMIYDAQSGCYYDTSTGYYYNPITGYWLINGSYFVYDQQRATYIPVVATAADTAPPSASAIPSAVAATAGPSESATPVPSHTVAAPVSLPKDVNDAAPKVSLFSIGSVKDKTQEDKARAARKAAKLMEKWEKQQQEQQTQQLQQAHPVAGNEASGGAQIAEEAKNVFGETDADEEAEQAALLEAAARADTHAARRPGLASSRLAASARVSAIAPPARLGTASVETITQAVATTAQPGLIASHPAIPTEVTVPGAATAATDNQTTEPGQMATLPSDPAELVNVDELLCLLCKRKFRSVDILRKHVAESELHKQNLAEYMVSPAYRNRAQERRRQFNPPEPPVARVESRSGTTHVARESFGVCWLRTAHETWSWRSVLLCPC